MEYGAHDIVFFIGAGASAPFGIPTMKQFVSDFEKYLDQKDESKERTLYNNIKGILETKLNRDIDLEDVFTVIQGIKDLTLDKLGVLSVYVYSPSQMPAIPHYGRETIETCASLEKKFQNFVREKCQISDQKSFNAIAEIYKDFFNRLATESRIIDGTCVQSQKHHYCPNWTIFTTNYDMCLESYWRNHVRPQRGLNTGFRLDESGSRWILDPETLFSYGRVRLLKLHGSISWLIGEDGIVTEEQTLGSSLIGSRYVGQMMIYPVQQKELYLEPFVSMFRILNSELRSKPIWIVIGYSFNDPIIREIFIRNSDDNKRIVFVHPNARKIRDKKLAKIKGDFSSLGRKFGEPHDFIITSSSIISHLRKPKSAPDSLPT